MPLTSMSSRARMERSTRRPMRPKPLMPTLSLAGAVAVAWVESAAARTTGRATVVCMAAARRAGAEVPAIAMRCVRSDALGEAATLVAADLPPAEPHPVARPAAPG